MIRLGVVIPAFDEEDSISQVVSRTLAAIPKAYEGRLVVVDNGSRDSTAERARKAGARLVSEPQRGYGSACLAGIEALGDWPEILLFLDADGSSPPEEMNRLLTPLQADQADLALGFRRIRTHMTLPQKWGSWLAITLLRLRWGYAYQDMGPFRAIRKRSYQSLGMTDRTWGWTIEMQILAVLRGLRIQEVEVSWSPRLAGVSKISGTVIGVLRAGWKILWTIGAYSVSSSARH